MADKAIDDGVVDAFASPVLSKGRGGWLSGGTDSNIVVGRFDVGGGVGRSQFMADSGRGTGLGQSPGCTPVGRFMGEGPHTSTPSSDSDAIHQLTDMVGQLGVQIGESIVAKLMASGVIHTGSDPQNASAGLTAHSENTRHEVPHVTVHVKSDKEPRTFRGDGSDKCSIQEWIEMTKTHLRKEVVPIHEQAEEILSRLRGKARDVVRIGLRSDPTLDSRQDPGLIYNILLHYFSDASSCLPLSDFYATLPRLRENPVDYWIRLNKAADLAVEGLCRQGKQTGNMSDEVALMFVKHCPDPELSYTLKCKPIHEWTSRDVQVRIDDYQRELRAGDRISEAVKLKSHTATVLPEQSSPSPVSLSTPEQRHPQVYHPSYSSPVSVPSRDEISHTPCPVSAPVVAQNLQQSEERLLSRMVDVFQGMMEKVQQRGTTTPMRRGGFQRGPGGGRPKERACRVCDDSRHSTISHCMSERLCFTCLAPGHSKVDCQANKPSQPQVGGN